MKLTKSLLAAVLILAMLPLGVLASDPGITGATTPEAVVQPAESRIELQNILHIGTLVTTNSIQRALNELGYAYDYIYDSFDWTWIDFSPYDIVVIGMNGGDMDDDDLLKIRTDVIDQGKRVIWIGGTSLQPFAIAVDNYLVPNDTNNHSWQVSASPQFTVVDPGHPLAIGLPSPYDFVNPEAGYYQLRVTDPNLEVVAVNGDGYDQLFYKGDNWPVLAGGPAPEQTGDLIWFINVGSDYFWDAQADFDVLKQIIDNAITYGEGEMTIHVEYIDGFFVLDYLGRPVLRAHVGVADQDGMMMSDVLVDAMITPPDSGPYYRSRYTKPNGAASFHWGEYPGIGEWQICVENLTLADYVYAPGDNVITCQQWYR